MIWLGLEIVFLQPPGFLFEMVIVTTNSNFKCQRNNTSETKRDLKCRWRSTHSSENSPEKKNNATYYVETHIVKHHVNIYQHLRIKALP